MASVAKRKRTKADGSNGDKWILRYVDVGGAHRQETFDRKKEADDRKRAVERELDDGTHVARRASRRMSDLFDEFLAHMDRREADGEVSRPHVESIRRSLGYAREHMGEVLLVELKWEAVERYAQALRRRDTQFLGRRFSNTTTKKALQALGQAVGYGVRRHYAARNVVTDAMKEIGTLPTAPIQPFTQDEMRRVVASIEDRAGLARRSQALLRAAVYLGAMCGLRRGEILGLRWSRIDFERGSLTIDASLRGTDDFLKETKTRAGIRIVPMPRMVADALLAWQPFIVEEARELIFRTFRGKAIADHNLYTAYWHPLLRRAGFQPVDGRHRHFHALRHFAGSAWLQGGVSLPEVSRLLGHANTGITAKIYSHAINDAAHRAPLMEQVASLICAPSAPLLTQDLRTGL